MAKRKNRKSKEVTRKKTFTFEWDGKEYGLTPLQKAFCKEYYNCNYHGVKAAKKAGYAGSDSTLRAIASQNLTKLNISAYLSYLLKDIGLNDHVVDRERLFLIYQKRDLGAKNSAIRGYDKIQGRDAPEKHEHKITSVEKVYYGKKLKEQNE